MNHDKKKVLNFSVSLADERSKHGNHKKISKDIRKRVFDHISVFSARKSHCSRSKNLHKKYLYAFVTIAEMHRLFICDNPDLLETCKYWLYHDIFNFEFSIKFRFPRSDHCDGCERFFAEIKASEIANNNILFKDLKTQHELHIRKADVFNVQTTEATSAAKLSQDTAVICINFEKNLQLPLTGIEQEYYKRQLWRHILCTHENVNYFAKIYLQAEIF